MMEITQTNKLNLTVFLIQKPLMWFSIPWHFSEFGLLNLGSSSHWAEQCIWQLSVLTILMYVIKGIYDRHVVWTSTALLEVGKNAQRGWEIWWPSLKFTT